MECERDARRLVRAKVSLIEESDRKKDMVDQLGNALTKAGIKAGSGPEVLVVYDQKTAGEPITNPHVRLPPLKAERLKKAVVLGQPRKMNLANLQKRRHQSWHVLPLAVWTWRQKVLECWQLKTWRMEGVRSFRHYAAQPQSSTLFCWSQSFTFIVENDEGLGNEEIFGTS